MATVPLSYCLSVHAGYRCRRTGACCTAGWHIPAEPAVAAAITRRFGSGGPLFQAPIDSAPAPAILATDPNGACVFFDAAPDRACRIHRDLGEHLLPSACRHFPRVALADPRGLRITLSHFCPTAAGLLFTADPLRIVPAPDHLSLTGTAEGLDATAALPPLLRPGMLMDFDGYDAWERACIEVLDTGGPDVTAALATIEAATREIRQWSPGGETLRDRVARVIAGVTSAPAVPDPAADARRRALAVASVPVGLAVPGSIARDDGPRPDTASLCRELDDVMRRYLATKLFAAWWPYLGLELIHVVEAIQVHAAVLRTAIAGRLAHESTVRDIGREAIRDTDLLMVHLSDSRALARLITRDS
jgi:hypothetical protein